MAVLDAQKSTLSIDDAVGTPVLIGGLVTFSGLDGEATEIDITTLDSDAKEFRQGLQDFGNVSLGLKRDPDNVGQQEMDLAKDLQSTREFILTLPSGHVFTFDGFVKSFSLELGVDSVVDSTSNIRITGAVVIS